MRHRYYGLNNVYRWLRQENRKLSQLFIRRINEICVSVFCTFSRNFLSLLPQLFCLFPSHSFLLRVKHFLFVPTAFQMKAEVHRPLFDSRNEGFKEMYQVLQELHFSGEFAIREI